MISAALFRSAADRTFTVAEYAVLIWCSGVLSFDRYDGLKLRKISRETGLGLSTVFRAVDRLIERRYLVEGKPDGRLRRLKLSYPRSLPSNQKSA